MARTEIKSAQIKDGNVKRDDLNIDETGQAVVRKIVAGTNVSLSSTGIDSGTGDVTINVTGGTGISSLNSQTGSSQTLVTGTSGTDFAISSSSNVHTFNIPDASATARGLVTTGTQTFAGAKTFSSAPTLSSVTASRPLKVDASNVVTSGLIDISSASDVTGTLPVANGGAGVTSVGTANQILGTNSGATARENKTLSTGTTGTDFNIAHTAGVVTFNIPTASATNRGLLSTTDWTTFNNKLSAAVTTLNTLTAATQTFATGTTGTDFGITSSGSTHTFNIPDASATARGLVTTGTQTIAGSKTFTGTTTSATLASTTINNIAASALTLGTTDLQSTILRTNGTNRLTIDSTGNTTLNAKTIVFQTLGGTDRWTIDDSTGAFTATGARNITTTGTATLTTISNTTHNNIAGSALTLGTTDAQVLNFKTNGTNVWAIATDGTLIGQSSTNNGIIQSTNTPRLFFRGGTNDNAPGLDMYGTGHANAGRVDFYTGLGSSQSLQLVARGTGAIVFSTTDSSTARWVMNNAGLFYGGVNTNNAGSHFVQLNCVDDNGLRIQSTSNRPQLQFGNSLGQSGIMWLDGGGFVTGFSGAIGVRSGGTGGVYLSNGATAWAAISDARKKKDISNWSVSLQSVLNLQPVNFRYLDESDESPLRVGLIAQNVEENIPEAVVVGNTEERMLGVAMTDLIPALICAIQELTARVKALEEK